MTSKEIHEDMIQILAEDSPFYAAVKKWATEFKVGRKSAENDPVRSSKKSQPFDAIYCMVLGNKCLAKSIGISSGSVHTEILGMRKMSARRVPRMLTLKHKLKRVDISRTLLIHLQASTKNFPLWFITFVKWSPTETIEIRLLLSSYSN